MFYVRRSRFDVLGVQIAAAGRRPSAVAGFVRGGRRMVARTFEQLEAWRLGNALKIEVYRLIAAGPASRDFSFCTQIRQSAASIPRKIAEGFGRFRPRAFAQFVDIAIGSAAETLDALQDGVDRGHFVEADTAHAVDLARRTIRASTRLAVYLKNAPADGPGNKAKRRRT